MHNIVAIFIIIKWLCWLKHRVKNSRFKFSVESVHIWHTREQVLKIISSMAEQVTGHKPTSIGVHCARKIKGLTPTLYRSVGDFNESRKDSLLALSVVWPSNSMPDVRLVGRLSQWQHTNIGGWRWNYTRLMRPEYNASDDDDQLWIMMSLPKEATNLIGTVTIWAQPVSELVTDENLVHLLMVFFVEGD